MLVFPVLLGKVLDNFSVPQGRQNPPVVTVPAGFGAGAGRGAQQEGVLPLHLELG